MVKKQIIKYGGGDGCRQVSDDDIVPREPEKLEDHRNDLGCDAKEDQGVQNPRPGSSVHPCWRMLGSGR